MLLWHLPVIPSLKTLTMAGYIHGMAWAYVRLKKTRGLILANFKRGAGDNAGVGGGLNDKAIITAPVRSYQPNDFGLYNMAGNVNEWVADTYRQTSFEEVDDLNPFRGNEFTNKRLADPTKGPLCQR
jgi:sulfatase modifying factor 1